MLLIDKYKITDKKNIKFHNDIYNKLLNLTPLKEKLEEECRFLTDKSTNKTFKQKCDEYLRYVSVQRYEKFKKLSNILIHGASGSGKKTLIRLFLQEIYGPQVNELDTESYKIVGYGNSEVDIDITQSKYHIIIEPNNTGIDKYIIQEVVKEYVRGPSFHFEKDLIPFKVVLINNVDNLSYYAQTSLRYTMEKYHTTCKFILCGYQISKILDPLRSRCLNIRIPRPTENELFRYLYYIIEKENIKIHPSTINHIISKSDHNIKICLWWLEYYINGVYDFTISWKAYLSTVVSTMHYIYKHKRIINVASITLIRQIYNNILITNINGSEIMIELMNQIITNHPEYTHDFMTKILFQFQKYEVQLSKGTRIITHLEALTMNLCKVFFDQLTM